MKVKLEACRNQSMQLERCWKITQHCVFRAMLFYSKGVAEFLIYQFLQIALPKERQGIRLADIRSAIKENQDFKRLLEDSNPQRTIGNLCKPTGKLLRNSAKKKSSNKKFKKAPARIDKSG